MNSASTGKRFTQCINYYILLWIPLDECALNSLRLTKRLAHRRKIANRLLNQTNTEVCVRKFLLERRVVASLVNETLVVSQGAFQQVAPQRLHAVLIKPRVFADPPQKMIDDLASLLVAVFRIS